MQGQVVRSAMGTAANARPAPGSVTQSSNVSNNGITLDRVQVTPELDSIGTTTYEIRNGSSWSVSTVPTDEESFLDVKKVEGAFFIPEGSPAQTISSAQAVLTGDIVYDDNDEIDLEASDDEIVYTIILSYLEPNSGSDTDYLAGGFWLVVPAGDLSAQDSTGYVTGAFADGSDPFNQSNLAALQGTASYVGEAAGVYSIDKSGGSNYAPVTGGSVRLEADFDNSSNLGTISGTITNMKFSGYGNNDDLVSLEPAFTADFKLEEADIGPSNHGFFDGSVTGQVTGQGSNEGYSSSIEGSWGGQFYGNSEADSMPGSVLGTFGARSNDDDGMSILGSFGAHKN